MKGVAEPAACSIVIQDDSFPLLVLTDKIAIFMTRMQAVGMPLTIPMKGDAEPTTCLQWSVSSGVYVDVSFKGNQQVHSWVSGHCRLSSGYQ